jgi:hypothetical protein
MGIREFSPGGQFFQEPIELESEEELLERVLYELRMRYVARTGKPG